MGSGPDNGQIDKIQRLASGSFSGIQKLDGNDAFVFGVVDDHTMHSRELWIGASGRNSRFNRSHWVSYSIFMASKPFWHYRMVAQPDMHP
jgi:hypothetical protein